MRLKTVLSAMTLSLCSAFAAPAETYRHIQGEVEITAVPEKVVVFSMPALDTVTALGVTPVGIAQIAIPAFMEGRIPDDVPRLGSLQEPDLEAVHAVDPDLIIIGGRTAKAYESLARIAPTMHVNVDRDAFMETARDNVVTLGRIFDKEQEAAALLASYDAEVAALRAVAPEAGRVLVLLASGGKISAHGPGSRFGIIHGDYGLTPAAEGLDTANHGQAISHEFILETDPDWIFVVDRDAAIGREGESAQQVLDNEIVHKTRAWQEGKLLYLDPAVWYLAASGITAMTAGAKQIREAISR